MLPQFRIMDADQENEEESNLKGDYKCYKKTGAS